MPASTELMLFVLLDFALTGVIAWAVWTLRSADATKRHTTMAVACLALICVGVVVCLLVDPNLIICLSGVMVLLLIYWVLLNLAYKMWK